MYFQTLTFIHIMHFKAMLPVSNIHGKEMETEMVWPHLKILWYGEDNSAGDSERSKKERKTEEMGRQHQ